MAEGQLHPHHCDCLLQAEQQLACQAACLRRGRSAATTPVPAAAAAAAPAGLTRIALLSGLAEISGKTAQQLDI